jgi:predicted metal-dependent peptidase
VTIQKHGLAVYLDVSGSVNDHLPAIIGVLQSLRTDLTSVFLFSNKVVEVSFQSLLQGVVRTTYGTDFDCVAASIVERGLDKAIVLTDGYASLKPELQEELQRRKVRIMTVLYGGKTACPEFASLGVVVQLEDVVH